MDETELKKHIQELSSEDLEVRRTAALTLVMVAQVNRGNQLIAEAAVPALTEALKDPDEYVRLNAAVALVQLDAVSNVPTLLEGLKNQDEGVRSKAVWALKTIIDCSSVEQLDKIKTQIIEAVDNADNAPTYREMKQAAAPLLVAINTRRNQLLTVEVNIDPVMVLKRPKPPRNRGGMYRAFAMVN